MPAFEGIEVKAVVDVDFEVFCGTCGAGLCNSSNTRNSHIRRMPQVTVDACEVCMESAAEKARSETADKYEEELAELRERIKELETGESKQ